MHLVLIGGKSADTISKIVEQNFDNLEVSVYQSISEFVSMSGKRMNMTVDRFILLQDALGYEDDLEDRLVSFNDYISKWFPAARFITITKDEDLTIVLCNVFLSPLMAHICTSKMKPTMLNELVGGSIEMVKSKYAYKLQVEDAETTTIGGVLTDPEEDENLQTEEQNEPSVEGKGKKKGGFLGLFGRKPKKSKGAKKNQTQNRQYLEASDTDMPKPVVKKGGNSDTLELPQPKTSQQNQNDENFDEHSGIDFSVFNMDGAQDLGIGVNIPSVSERYQEEVEEIQEQGEETHEEEHFPSSAEDIDFSAFEEEGELTFPEDEIETEEKEPSFEGKEDTIPSNEEVEYLDNDSGFNIISDGVESSETQEEEIDIFADTEAKANKLKELQSTLFSKDINMTDYSDEPNVPTLNENVDITEVDVSTPVIDNLDTLVEQYNNQNVRVVEKVVETVVEKVINTGNKKAYKNGIRTIIVTGDRKTGVTRTALNMASNFAKDSKTLYVDFDLNRKGSLLYLGIDNVIDEEDHIQNGLLFAKNTKTLKNITYQFSKGGFDCLLTMFGMEIAEEQLTIVQRVLTSQREFTTVIIDCPLENLRYLTDIVLYSEILICVEPTLPNAMNTVLGLSTFTDSEKFKTFVYNNSSYFLSGSDELSEFKANLSYVSDIFSLEDESFNWGSVRIIGTVSEFAKVLAEF